MIKKFKKADDAVAFLREQGVNAQVFVDEDFYGFTEVRTRRGGAH